MLGLRLQGGGIAFRSVHRVERRGSRGCTCCVLSWIGRHTHVYSGFRTGAAQSAVMLGGLSTWEAYTHLTSSSHMIPYEYFDNMGTDRL
ncbi:hypothetical protein LINGRAHAP2_LOCUS27495 [Linum grandiflorum]